MRFATLILPLALLGCDPPPPPSAPVAAPVETEPAVVAAPPRPLSPQLQAALRLVDQGRFDAARDLATRAAQLDPADGRAELILGLTYHKAGNHGPAARHLRRAVETMPDDPAARHFLADCLFMLGDVDGAREHHAAHARLDPAEPDARYGLGMVELEARRLDEAERQFNEAITLYEAMERDAPRKFAARQPSLARCHARLADVHFARDDYDAARASLLVSTTIAPQNISAFYTLSLVERRLGNDAAADAALERYVEARDAIIEARGGAP